MKKLIIILIFLPGLLYGQFYSEIWSGFQLNYPTKSSVAPAIGRLRIGAIILTVNQNIRVNIRTAYAFGESYFGSTGLMTPANDIAVDDNYPVIDECYFLFKKKRLVYTIGLIDPYDTSDGYSGFFNDYFIGDENTGFLSTHLLRLLATNSMDQPAHQSIPSAFFYLQLHEYFRVKAGLTFGMATTHLFLRNTLPVELEFKTTSFHISLNAGFGDADSSGTHSISPSYGIIIEKKLFTIFNLFAKASTVQHDISTFRTPDIKNIDY